MTKHEKKNAIQHVCSMIVGCTNIDQLETGIQKVSKEVYSSPFTSDAEPALLTTMSNVINKDFSNFADSLQKTHDEKIKLMIPIQQTLFNLIDSSSLPS